MLKSWRYKGGYALLVAGIIGFDQWTKGQALELLSPGQVESVFGDWFQWRLAFNRGIAFSLGHERGLLWAVIIRWVGLLLTLSLLFWMFLVIGRRKMTQGVALAFIVGGALGNLWDRFMLDHVIDFIDVGVHHWRWPTFNVADGFITLGVLLLVYCLYQEPEEF